MDNEATSAVDSAATSSTPATTPAHSEHTNTASGTRVPPLGECGAIVYVCVATSGCICRLYKLTKAKS